MKTPYLITVILAVALLVTSIQLLKARETEAGSMQADSLAIQNILTRTSVRAYQDKPVEQDKIEAMLRAAMAAPSAVNRQPWHYVVVTEKSRLAALAQTNPYAKFVADAPLAIAVCGDMKKAMEGAMREFWVQDCSAASENLMLAANALGLGSVWTAVYPDEARCAAVSEVLQLAKHLVPLNVIAIGYPEGETTPKDKWNEDNITYLLGRETAEAATPQEKKAEFAAIDVNKDFRENGFTFFADRAPILLSGDRESYNAMTIGWGAIGNIWGHRRPTLTVYVAQKRYTLEFMNKKKYFTVMTFADPHVAEYMGSHSGRDTDKAKDLGLTVAYTEHGTPYFEEAKMVLECEVMYGEKMSEAGFRNDVPKNMYADFPAGIHSWFMGEVVSAMKKK